MEGGDGVGLAQAQVPQRRGVALLGGGVDLVGGQDNRLARAAQHLDHAGVGGRDADLRVDDEDDGVSQLDGDLSLRGHGLVEPLDVQLPAAGVHDREAASSPLRRVGHSVTGHARGVLDDGDAAAEHAVDERGLADVGTTHDGEHRQPGIEPAVGLRHLLRLQQRPVLLVQLVVLQPGTQRRGPQVLLSVPGRSLVQGLLNEVDHVLHGLLKRHVAGVDQRHALGRGEELGDGGIVAVAAHHLVPQSRGVHHLAGRLQVCGPASQTRLLAGGHQQTDLRLRSNDGRDVTTLGHDPGAAGEGGSVAEGLGVDDLALEARQLGAHGQVGRHGGDHLRDMRLANRLADVHPVAHDGGSLRVKAHIQGHRLHSSGHRLRISQVHAAALTPPGSSAVHGAGVQVRQPQMGSHALGDGRLTRPARSVDSDDDSHPCLLHPARRCRPGRLRS